jgi:pyruvate dehydrogenase E2 component (dihydrolipoyllysine-residue acetyltransferase)
MATELIMPRLSDSMEEGTILKWLVAEGDRVEPGQALVEVETDKATVTHEAEVAGVVLALNVSEGASVPVGAPIAVLGEPGEELPRAAAPEAVQAASAFESAERPGVGAPRAAAAAPASAPAPALANGGRVKASPLARRLAAKAGIELAGLSGSGPQGRVIRSDVERAIAGAGSAAGGSAVAGPPVAGNGTAPGSEGDAQFEDLSRLQQTVARRMAQSRAEVPDIELRSQVDMSEAVTLREQLRSLGDVLPSYNDFVVKAAAIALRQFPRVNGAYRDGRFELFARVNVGIAVAGDNALVVPTVFDADRKSLGEIARVARELAGRARDGSIAPAELEGGTFTISNLGMFGVDSFSAVINQPQAAILTVGALAARPVVDEGGAIVARPTIMLTLVCDHRILYGADGARFLARVRELLEHPLAMLVA